MLATKQAGDIVRITFDISDLVDLTLLQVSYPKGLSKQLNVFLPFVIIAAGTGQHHLITSLANIPSTQARVSQLAQVKQATASGSRNNVNNSDLEDNNSENEIEVSEVRYIEQSNHNTLEDEVEISEVRRIKRKRVVLDLTSIDDDIF